MKPDRGSADKKGQNIPKPLGAELVACITKLPGGSDVQNIYILMGFHQGLIIIKYEKVNLKKNQKKPYVRMR